MIDSILYSWSELKVQLEDQEQHRLNAIDKNLLSYVLVPGTYRFKMNFCEKGEATQANDLDALDANSSQKIT